MKAISCAFGATFTVISLIAVSALFFSLHTQSDASSVLPYGTLKQPTDLTNSSSVMGLADLLTSIHRNLNPSTIGDVLKPLTTIPGSDCNCEKGDLTPENTQDDCSKSSSKIDEKASESGFIPLAPSLIGKPDSCWSRHERARFLPPSEFKPSKALIAAIRRYEVLHHNCTVKVKDWDAAYEGVETQTGEDGAPRPCQYIVWSITGAVYSSGFGNRMTSLIGAFLFALLTDRVLLVDTFIGDQFPSLLCNPFPDSSWWTPLTEKQHEVLYTKPTVDDYARDLVNDPKNFDRRYAVFDWGMFGLFCGHVQSALGNATWLHYTTFLYQTPPIFGVPMFRGRLREWFPDNEAFVHLTRYLLYPSNDMWARISVAAEARLGAADVRIGLQIRDVHGYKENITQRAITCIEGFNLLPRRPSEKSWNKTVRKPDIVGRREKPQIASLLVTALGEEYYRDLKKYYERRTGRDKPVVSVFSESHEHIEDRKLSQSQQALLEIWLLSFSDHLIISFMSTFGYLAASLSGRLPIYLNIVERFDVGNAWTTNGAPVCERAITLEACMHIDPTLHCGNDGYFVGYRNGKDLGRYKAVQPCRDYSEGIVVLHDPLPKRVEAVGDDGMRRNLTLVFE